MICNAVIGKKNMYSHRKTSCPNETESTITKMLIETMLDVSGVLIPKNKNT